MILLLLLLAVPACRSSSRAASDRLRVVAAFYPLAEAARQVGGSVVDVENLTPAGSEPHDIELRPSQVADLKDADVALLIGRGFQPAVERAAPHRASTVLMLDHGDDPHIWLDPVRMSTIVDRTAAALTAAAPAHRTAFAANAARYRARLADLDRRYREGLATCARREIVTGHLAFGYLAARYHLVQHGVAGVAPDAEPDPRRLAELTDLVRRDGVTTIFTETLVSPKVAQTLAREAGVRTDVLDPLEGLTKDEVARGEDYVSVMGRNLTRLRAALGCR